MKFKAFSIIFLLRMSGLVAMQSQDGRLSPKGQYEYFSGIKPLIAAQKFNEARERIEFLRTARRLFVREEALDEVENELTQAIGNVEKERAQVYNTAANFSKE